MLAAADWERALFCARWLGSHGVDAEGYSKLLGDSASIRGFDIVPSAGGDFFTEVAEGLRALWPPGLKGGRWPWRDSAANLSQRLRTLWRLRRLDLGGYTKDDVLACARAYTSSFEGDATYMKLLRYWVLKTTERGGVRQVESQLADMLEERGRCAPAADAATGCGEGLGLW